MFSYSHLTHSGWGIRGRNIKAYGRMITLQSSDTIGLFAFPVPDLMVLWKCSVFIGDLTIL